MIPLASKARFPEIQWLSWNKEEQGSPAQEILQTHQFTLTGVEFLSAALEDFLKHEETHFRVEMKSRKKNTIKKKAWKRKRKTGRKQKEILYLQDFALRTLIKQQSLLVGGVQVLLHYFGFLLGQAHAILQHIHLHVGRCRQSNKKRQQGVKLLHGHTDWTKGAKWVDFNLPGMFLEPGLGVNPLAWLTSTSSCPPLSTMPTWTSPADGKKTHLWQSSRHLHNQSQKLHTLWCSWFAYTLWFTDAAMANI